MEKFSGIYKSIALVLVVIVLATMASNPRAAKTGAATQVDYAWDILCSGTVLPVPKKLKQRRNDSSIEVKDSIKLCTKHVYQFSGKAGQRIEARLTGTTQTWLILSRKGGAGLITGTRNWEGRLPEDGKYILQIVTTERDATSYTVRLTFH
jgi:hypothetical protein